MLRQEVVDIIEELRERFNRELDEIVESLDSYVFPEDEETDVDDKQDTD